MPVTSACQAGLPQVTSRKPGAGAGGGLVQPVRTSAVWRLFCGTQAAGDESWLSPPRLSPKTFSVFKSQTRWVTKIKKTSPCRAGRYGTLTPLSSKAQFLWLKRSSPSPNVGAKSDATCWHLSKDWYFGNGPMNVLEWAASPGCGSGTAPGVQGPVLSAL